MENEEIKEQEIVETGTTDVEETLTENNENEEPNSNEEKAKTFTQEQVNDFVRNRLDRVYSRYGVKDKQGLDDIVTKAKSYETMEERYNQMQTECNEMREKLAFIENNINPERYEDVKVHFKGKGLEFNNENLMQELTNHPEWLNVVKEDNNPKTTIKTIGNDTNHRTFPKDEKEEAAKLFGLKKFI